MIPGALLLGLLLGWLMAGRALTPVLAVAQAAQRISGANLSLRIPTRGAGDELDYLILAFNRMNERLEASFQQIKQFSTDVSHELRTPITAIRGQLEVALFTAKTTDQYREAMFNALQDIDRLSQIVRALLLLSQAESGQLMLQKSRLNLCEVVEDLVEQFQIPAEAAGVHLTADLAPECPAEDGYARQLDLGHPAELVLRERCDHGEDVELAAMVRHEDVGRLRLERGEPPCSHAHPADQEVDPDPERALFQRQWP